MNLYILIGLSASGKSTYAQTTLENCTYISSDKIREELSFYEDQSRNNEVFQILHKRVDKALSNGEDVVVDATNITIKSRKPIIEIGKKYKAKIIGILFVCPVASLQYYDSLREHSVGTEVISKQLKKFEVPFIEEGFDDIKIECRLKYNHISLEGVKHMMKGFNQYNPHHKLDLWEHSYSVMKRFLRSDKRDAFDIDYLYGVLFHDIGKLFTQKFDNDGVAHYYNHENVGAYYFILCVKCNPDKYLLDDIYKDDVLLENAFIINYHMRPFDWNTDKAYQKANDIFGWGGCYLLEKFNEADKESC